MLIHIANYFDADRRSALAGEDLPLGAVCAVSAGTGTAAGNRVLTKVTAAGDLKPGKFGVAFKVSSDPLQVTSSTVNADSHADLGSRVVAIKSGDQIVEVREGAIVEYHPSLLDDSLNPAAASPGTLPAIGDALGIKAGKWCAAGASGAITSPVVGRVYDVVGGKVRVELVSQ